MTLPEYVMKKIFQSSHQAKNIRRHGLLRHPPDVHYPGRSALAFMVIDLVPRNLKWKSQTESYPESEYSAEPLVAQHGRQQNAWKVFRSTMHLYAWALTPSFSVPQTLRAGTPYTAKARYILLEKSIVKH